MAFGSMWHQQHQRLVVGVPAGSPHGATAATAATVAAAAAAAVGSGGRPKLLFSSLRPTRRHERWRQQQEQQQQQTLPRSRRERLSVAASLSSSSSSSSSSWFSEANGSTVADKAVLLEVEGVMVDLHRTGHLEAFNSAFLSMGFDWARWTTSTYNDLHRLTGGSTEAMIQIFFDRVRWPMKNMTAEEKEGLVARVATLKEDALQRAISANAIPMRPGVVEFLEEARQGGVRVAVLVFSSRCGEDNARMLLQRLPPHLREWVTVVGRAEAEASAYWQVSMTGGATTGLDEALAAQLSEAVAARRQMVAEQVAKALRVRPDVPTGGRQLTEGVACLRAACEVLGGVPLHRSAVLAGSQSLVQLAARAGLPCVAVRSSLTAQAEFSGALQAYQEFGAGSLTIPRLLRRLNID